MRDLGLRACGFALALLVLTVGTAQGQVSISSSGIKIAGKDVVATPVCTNGKVPKRSGSQWVCGDDLTGAGDISGLCALYSLTGQTPDPGIGCPAQEKRVIFATSTFYEGNLGGNTGVTGADFICNSRASAGGLAGAFKAWIADNNASNDPESRFVQEGPLVWYVLPDDTIVAIGWDDLTDGFLEVGISVNEFGNAITTGPTGAWTNVNRNGTRRSTGSEGHCTSWTDNVFDNAETYSNICQLTGTGSQPTQVGYRGSTSSTSTTFSWTEAGVACCDADSGGAGDNDSLKGRLICVEQ